MGRMWRLRPICSRDPTRPAPCGTNSGIGRQGTGRPLPPPVLTQGTVESPFLLCPKALSRYADHGVRRTWPRRQRAGTAGSGGPMTTGMMDNAPRGLSLSLSLSTVVHHSPPCRIKGGERVLMQGSSLGETHETHGKHTRPRRDQVDGWSPPEAHKHTLTTGKEAGGAPSSSRRQLP